MNTLEDHLQLERVSAGVYERDCDQTFWGRNALFGGYPQALALAAIAAELERPDQSPKAVSIHFLRPFLEGRMTIEVVVERSGRTMSNATVRMTSGGKLAGLVLANFGTEREAPSFLDASPPEVAVFDPDEAPTRPRVGIPTHDLFDFWPRLGPVDFVPTGVAESGGWVRPIERWPIDVPLITLLHDLWLPAAYNRWTQPAIVAVSADITAHYRAPLPADDLDPDQPLFVALRSKAALNGFVDEDSEVWTVDGRLLGISRQVRYITPITG